MSLLSRDISSPDRLRVNHPTDWSSRFSNTCRRNVNTMPSLITVVTYESATGCPPGATSRAER